MRDCSYGLCLYPVGNYETSWRVFYGGFRNRCDESVIMILPSSLPFSMKKWSIRIIIKNTWDAISTPFSCTPIDIHRERSVVVPVCLHVTCSSRACPFRSVKSTTWSVITSKTLSHPNGPSPPQMLLVRPRPARAACLIGSHQNQLIAQIRINIKPTVPAPRVWGQVGQTALGVCTTGCNRGRSDSAVGLGVRLGCA